MEVLEALSENLGKDWEGLPLFIPVSPIGAMFYSGEPLDL
jgi:hypothetical protein